MDILTIARDYTTSNEIGTWMFIDQVELFPFCAPNLPIQNRTFNMNEVFPYTASIIKAGSEIISWWPQGEVVIKATASMAKFKASQEVQLKPGFKVERGGDFRAWIAPCINNCPSPLANAGRDTTICGEGCINIGGENKYGIVYEWTAKPENAIQYLSATNISNPTVCPPTQGVGRLRYKVKATNSCGVSREDEVIVDYDRNPNPIPNFILSNIDLSDSLNFDITVDPHTETVKVEIMTCNNQVLETYEYDAVDDFSCCNFKFRIPDYFNPCVCYKVKVSSKNYCYDFWKETIFDWPRNQNFSLLSTSNFICKNKIYEWAGWFNIVVRGALAYDITIRDRGNHIVFQKYDYCTEDTIPIWHPGTNVASTYFIVLKLYDCNGGVHDYTYYVDVFDNCSPKQDLNSQIFSNVAPNKNNSEIENIYNLLYHPNPVTSILNIEGHLISKANKFTIYLTDVLGNCSVIYAAENLDSGPFNFEVNLNNFRSGIYYLTIVNDYNKSSRKISIIK